MSDHVSSKGLLYSIFLALIALTALTVWAAYQDFGAFNTVVAMAIATFKAVLVVVFFMEMRFGQPLSWAAAITGILFFALLVGLTMSDILTRNLLGIPGS